MASLLLRVCCGTQGEAKVAKIQIIAALTFIKKYLIT